MTFTPIPHAAAVAAADGIYAWHPYWDEETDCESSSLFDHNHDDCRPTGWWPDRDVVAAAAVRGLVDAGWTLTPPVT